MPNGDFIPRRLADRLAFYQNFNVFLAAHGAAQGIPAGEITIYDTNLGTLETRIPEVATAEVQTAALRESRDDLDGGIEALTRSMVRRLQASTTMTDNLRIQAGITVPGAAPPGGGVGPATPAPLILVNTENRGRPIIYWGPNPGDGRNNARPDGVRGARIEKAVITNPALPKVWVHLKDDPRSPHVDEIDNTETVTVAYRARYYDNAGNNSAWSDEETVAVSPV